ncbi:MAG: ABC transporter ATP-binding protein [Bacteroidales bacterium]|nr:ABC transporter ATP-binding protein [Bacteroidales bacterium]
MCKEAVLSVKGLKVSFGGGEWHEVVHGVDFDVFKGKTLGIVGESGSGKSVSSLAVMKLLNERRSRITAETISLNGVDIRNFSQKEMCSVRGAKIAMIFQEPMTSLNPVFRCGPQITEAIIAHEKVCNEDAKKRVIDLFKKVLLPRPEKMYDNYPHELSGGQKQRVMIAMALACKPEILIADEPTTALDVTVQKEILLLLKRLQKENGMGMIFITHDLAVVSEIADEIAVMHNGSIVEKGSTDDILKKAKDPYTRGLLACRPPMGKRLSRLPIVREFIDGVWKNDDDILKQLSVSAEDRRSHLESLYSSMPLLKVEHLKTYFPLRKGLFNRVYDHVRAVDDVSFDVYPGETLGLVGESGCGKTTTGRSILRLIEPTSGKIIFDGIDVMSLKGKALRDFRKQAQIVFQDPYSSLNPRVTVGDAIAEPMEVHGIETDAKKRRERVAELLREVGLDPESAERYPHEFSGGQRQRICIARAIAVRPRLIICDESVSALDVSVQAQVLNLLNRLKKDFGFTYIFISHDLGVVRFMSDRILVMRGGRPVELADADDIFINPKDEYTRHLIDAIPGIR